jgi:hypothetical protein
LGCRLIATRKYLPGNSTRADHTARVISPSVPVAACSQSRVGLSSRRRLLRRGGALGARFAVETWHATARTSIKLPDWLCRPTFCGSVMRSSAGAALCDSVARLRLTRLKCRCSQVPCGRHDPAFWLRHANSVGAARPFKRGKRNWEQRLTDFARVVGFWWLRSDAHGSHGSVLSCEMVTSDH